MPNRRLDIMTGEGKYILLYDGDCRFCNRWVQWVVDRDRDNLFRFAAIESEFSKDLHNHLNINIDADSIAIVSIESLKDEKLNTLFLYKSKAVSCLFLNLKPSSLLYKVLKVTPRFLADFVYDGVAAIRGFLPVPDCRLYSSEEKQLFLNEIDFAQFIS